MTVRTKITAEDLLRMLDPPMEDDGKYVLTPLGREIADKLHAAQDESGTRGEQP